MLCVKCEQSIDKDSVFCKWCGWKQSKVYTGKKPKQRGNGQGSVYKLPNGKYRAVVILGYKMENGKSKPVTRTRSDFARMKDAIAYLPELRKEIVKQDKITLTELHNMFLNTKKYEKLSKSQKDKLGYAWNRLSDISFFEISNLSLERMQAVVDSQVTTYYPARDMKVMLSHLYDTAIKHGHADRNPTEYIELPETEKSKRDAWKSEEVQSFWRDYEAGNKFTGYILIMIYAGLRYGELPIPKENIFLDERYMIGGIKTEAGIDRTIPLKKCLVPIIDDFCRKNKKKLLEMNQDNFYDAYWKTIERLGVRKLSPHCCRHTYFTEMAKAGVQPGVITAAGGHKSYQTTLGYTHLPLESLIQAVDDIDI